MNEAALLSICIATMNRGRQLKETVMALLAQTDARCEIVIVDGASSDDTEQIGRELARTSRQVRYFREPINSGVDADYDRAVGYATGSYCWLLTDDDRLLPDAVPHLLERLAEKPPLVIVNAEVRDASNGRCLIPRRLPIDKDRVYSRAEFEKFFVDCIRYLSFIGAVVIRRDVWLARERRAYYGTAFIHIGVIFQAPLDGSVIAIAQPGLCLQYGRAGWRSRAFDIWVVKWPQLIWSFNCISTASRRSICPKAPWGDPRYLLLHRALGNYGLEHYRSLVAGRLIPGWRKVAAWLAARIPVRPMNFVAWNYFRLLDRTAPMLLTDLESESCHWRKKRDR